MQSGAAPGTDRNADYSVPEQPVDVEDRHIVAYVNYFNVLLGSGV